MSDILNLLKSRRSIRKFKEKEVEKEKIDVIIKSALLSPSSRGLQPWKFIVVTDRELIEKLSESKQNGSQFLKGAPLAIVIAADTSISDVWVEDASIAATIIQLAASELSLGSCWIQIRNRPHEEGKSADSYLNEILNLPENYSMECIIGIGYPNEEKKAYTEADMLFGKVRYIDGK